MTNEELLRWHETEPLLKILRHVGNDGGLTTLTAARTACRRATNEIERLTAELAAYDRVARRLTSR